MKPDETIEYYRMRAGEYDHMYTWDDPGRQDELAELYGLAREALSDRQVLDIACGTGHWANMASITGIDINAATLSEARKKIYKCPVQFLRADVFNHPWANREFDGLLMTFILSHIRRQEVEELALQTRRVLKPGSVAFICDSNLTDQKAIGLEWDDERINSYKMRRLENGREFRILKNFYEKEELIAMLKLWGEIENLTYKTWYWSAVVTIA